MGINRNLSDLSRSVSRKRERMKLLAVALVSLIVLSAVICLIVYRTTIFDLRDNEYNGLYLDGPVRIHIVTDDEVGIYDNYDADEIVVSYYSDGDDYDLTVDGNDIYVTYTGKKPLFKSKYKDDMYLDIGANVNVESIDIVSGSEVYFNQVKIGKADVDTAKRIYMRNCYFDELNIISKGDSESYDYNHIDTIECGTLNVDTTVETDLYDCTIDSLKMTLNIDDRFARSDIENCRIGDIDITSNSEIDLILIGSEEEYAGKININTTAKHPIVYVEGGNDGADNQQPAGE